MTDGKRKAETKKQDGGLRAPPTPAQRTEEEEDVAFLYEEPAALEPKKADDHNLLLDVLDEYAPDKSYNDGKASDKNVGGAKIKGLVRKVADVANVAYAKLSCVMISPSDGELKTGLCAPAALLTWH
jgi:hypothetical protein